MATSKDNLHVREKLVELLNDAIEWAGTFDATGTCYSLNFGVVADVLIANNVTVQEEGYWINIPPYRAINGDYNKAQECPKCHAFFVSNGNEPYSNHPYCCECGARLSPQPPKGE